MAQVDKMNNINIKTDTTENCWQIESAIFCLRNLSSGLIVKGQTEKLNLIHSEHNNNTSILKFENDNAVLKLTAFTQEDKLILESELQAKKDIFINSVALAQLDKEVSDQDIELGDKLENYRILINSDNSWGKTGNCPLLPSQRNKSKGDIRSVKGGMVTAIWSATNSRALLIGTAEESNYPLTYLWTKPQNHSQAGFSLYKSIGINVKANQKYKLGQVVFAGTKDITSELEAYAENYFNFDSKAGKKIIGWSSWDYYLANPKMIDIQENINSIKNNNYLKDKINLISIDLGWSKIEGDWRSNIDFPKHRENIADYIHSEGFKAGIWTMPLVVSPFSDIACRKLKWLIKDSDGFPVNVNKGQYDDAKFSLDPTIPQVSSYVFDLYRTLKNEGFEYFKLDFLRQSCRFPEHSLFDKQITRTEMLRETIKTIRKAVGKESVICACGAPFEAVQGLVDYIRVCDDVKNHWSNIQRSARSIIHRYWSHKRLWSIDSDFLIVRGSETADISEDRFITYHNAEHEPFHWLSGKTLSENEAKVWASICVMTGSCLILGDRIEKLNPRGLEVIKQAIENQKESFFRPLDLEASSMPSIWHRFDNNDNEMYAFFNFTEESKEIDFNKYNIAGDFESIWESNSMTTPTAFTIPPRNVVLLKKI